MNLQCKTKTVSTLVFCAGAPNLDLSLLQQINPDVLVGVDGGAARLVAHGYIPDWAIGDFDSAMPPEQSHHILRLPCEKDDTDLEYALMYILSHYHPSEVNKIIILGALGGGRLDHLLCNIWLAHQPRFAPWLDKMYFVEYHSYLRFFYAGKHRLLPENHHRYLSFIGLTAIQKLSLSGVKYPLDGCDFSYPMALISNEFIDDVAYFSFEKGTMAVIQASDDGRVSDSL